MQSLLDNRRKGDDMRVVTTLPTATEIVTALGVTPVGTSHECDYPDAVRSLPQVTSSVIDADGSSGEIDRQVTEAIADGTDGVYDVDVETLDTLDPELVITQGMCDVCAVDDTAIRQAVATIDADPTVLTTDPHTVGDVLTDVGRIGQAIDRTDRARELVTELETRIETVRKRTATLENEDRPRVAIFDWTDPVMVAGHWTAELVEWAGGRYDLADRGEASRPREWREIVTNDPDVVIVAPCGFDLTQTAANLTDLTDREGWDDLTAVRTDRVWAMDGNHYLNRPSHRLIDTLEALASIVHPNRFDGPSSEIAVPIDQLEAGRPA